MSTFTAETYQNEYLPSGADEVNAIVTVTASGTGGAASAVGAGGDEQSAEIIIVDMSGSMEGAKLVEAKKAVRAAIDAIPDGVQFAVIAGEATASEIFPGRGRLVEANNATREKAKQAVGEITAGGGTHIGQWLLLARDLFSTTRAPRRHAILLTDGRIDGESLSFFRQCLKSCVGLFQCDARGVGTDWEVSQLREIADALLGTVDIVPDPTELAEEFAAMMAGAVSKSVASVSLRLWCPQGAEVRYVKQVAPTIVDLTPKAVQVNPLTRDFPTGAWADESRDYHVCVRVKVGGVGTEMLAGRISLVVDDQVVSQALVKAIWTDDSALSTKIDPQVAHYTGQAELAQAIHEGLEARKTGDEDAATTKLGKAVKLAAESGNEATMKLLRKVVDVDDEQTGTVRLKRGVEAADEMALDTRSTRTVRTKKP